MRTKNSSKLSELSSQSKINCGFQEKKYIKSKLEMDEMRAKD